MNMWWDLVERYEEEMAPFDPDYVPPKKKAKKGKKQSSDLPEDDTSTSDESSNVEVEKTKKKVRKVSFPQHNTLV